MKEIFIKDGKITTTIRENGKTLVFTRPLKAKY